MARESITFYLNGQRRSLRGADVFAPLSDTLRYVLGHTGTKVVCAEGDCGACTVMVARAGSAGEPRFRAINACIASTFLLDGCHVVTIEGLAEPEGPCEIQHAMIRNHGGQCGFCTPGIVMALANMHEAGAPATERAAKNYLTGNLCRCTGYTPILRAATDIDRAKQKRCADRYLAPAAEAELRELSRESARVSDGERELFAPATLAEATEYLSRHPEARIFSGATDVGVQLNKGRAVVARRLSLHLIPELYTLEVTQDRITIGARVSLADFETAITPIVPELGAFLRIFASPQIKNAGTLVGNLANASPIGDTLPFLLTAQAVALLSGASGDREVPLASFFRGYRQLDLRPGEFIRAVSLPRPAPSSRRGLYKISQRRDLDVSAVSASFDVAVDGGRVTAAAIAYGGVAATPVRLPAVESFLVGQTIDRALVDEAKRRIAAGIHPVDDVRGSARFRTLMAENLFEKFARERLLP